MNSSKINGQKQYGEVQVELSTKVQKLLGQDTHLADLCEQLKDEEQAKEFLTHLKSKEYLVSRRELTAIFGKNGEYLNQLLGETGYQPVDFSTGEELEKAIGSTSFLVDHWLPRGHVTAIVSSPGVGDLCGLGGGETHHHKTEHLV